MTRLLYILCFLVLCNASAQQKWARNDAETFQIELNSKFSNLEESPLTKEDLQTFKSLEFFPIEEKFAVIASFKKARKSKAFKMKTTTSRLPEYKKYGELHFELDGKKLVLNVYQNIELIKKRGYEDYLFLPFTDLSCGKESYIGGRYIDMRIPKSDQVLLDFNRAYNPYCAYNYKYSCPLVPFENDLNVAIYAGVKKFHE